MDMRSPAIWISKRWQLSNASARSNVGVEIGDALSRLTRWSCESNLRNGWTADIGHSTSAMLSEQYPNDTDDDDHPTEQRERENHAEANGIGRSPLRLGGNANLASRASIDLFSAFPTLRQLVYEIVDHGTAKSSEPVERALISIPVFPYHELIAEGIMDGFPILVSSRRRSPDSRPSWRKKAVRFRGFVSVSRGRSSAV